MSRSHAYVADGNRSTTFFALGLLGLLSGVALGELQGALGYTLPSWLDVPGAFGFAGLYFVLWDRYLWRARPFRWLLNATPNISGRWSVELRSSYDGHTSVIVGAVTIRQTWTRISISFVATQSQSCSVAASLVQSATGWALLYHYDNAPDAAAPASMERHDGTAWLEFSNDLHTANGHYFTGRGRMTQGSLHLTRS